MIELFIYLTKSTNNEILTVIIMLVIVIYYIIMQILTSKSRTNKINILHKFDPSIYFCIGNNIFDWYLDIGIADCKNL
jgi:hypothetical protein